MTRRHEKDHQHLTVDHACCKRLDPRAPKLKIVIGLRLERTLFTKEKTTICVEGLTRRIVRVTINSRSTRNGYLMMILISAVLQVRSCVFFEWAGTHQTGYGSTCMHASRGLSQPGRNG